MMQKPLFILRDLSSDKHRKKAVTVLFTVTALSPIDYNPQIVQVLIKP